MEDGKRTPQMHHASGHANAAHLPRVAKVCDQARWLSEH